MKQDTRQPEVPLDEALPRAFLKAFRALPSEQGQPAPETDAAVLADARKILSAVLLRRIRSHFWPVLATAACVTLVFNLLSRPDSSPVSTAPPSIDDKYALILREVSAVFPEQLKAIIAEGGELRISLSDQPQAGNKQAVVVELCENQKYTTVITYLGQTVEFGGHLVTVRTDEDGTIVVDLPGSQGTDDPSQNSGTGLHIRTRRI